MTLEKLVTHWLPRRRQQPDWVPGGMYSHMREIDGQAIRFHLRVDADGTGILLANATAAARLSASGVWMAKHLLEDVEPETIVDRVCRLFDGATRDAVQNDVKRIQQLIADLETPGDNYPILNLVDAALTGQAARLDKPLSADVPLAEPERLVPLLDRLWAFGIPHVTLLVPEAPAAKALVHAVERAEDLGMIAGVRGRASDLHRQTLLKDLAMAGVDHVNLLYLSTDAQSHDALAGKNDLQLARQAIDAIQSNEVCVLAEMALVDQTLETIAETLEDLASRNVCNIGFFAMATDEPDDRVHDGALTPEAIVHAAGVVEDAAEDMHVRFLWYAPVQRCRKRDSIAEQVRLGPRASGDHAVRIEPDGQVYPARGPWHSAGNVFQDDWQTIQSDPNYARYHTRVTTDTHCDACPSLAICAADCPRTPDGWSQPVE